jgi:ESCRT-I complex subunit TSG101
MYVDHNGKVYLPYLHDWSPASSDLVGLIQVMAIVFGEHPPLYSKPKQETTTPYPSGGYGMPQPNAQPSAFGGSYPMTSNFPPYPPYPNANPSSQPPYPTSGFGMQNPSPYNPQPQQQNTNTGTIGEEHIKASLISAIEDKMRRRIQEKVNQCQAEIQTLKRTKQELTDGQTKLTELISKLERDEFELKKNIQLLKDKDTELTKSLDTLEENDQIDVDEAVTTTAPLYKQ